ncbi:MAG: S8 family serine peptidase [Clostridia bacterium]|nr:S8 family serine peptidase [Clostridia bacterium]
MSKHILIMFVTLFFYMTPFKVQADSGGYIVKFVPDTIPPDIKFERLFDNTYYTKDINNLNGLEGYVEYVEPDDMVELIEPVNRRTKTLQRNSVGISETQSWQSEMVKADFAWELATYGNGVNVAIIDSGCNTHTDIIGNLAGGHNYILNTDDYSDNIGHGTHVAGIIAAEHNNFGIMGVAPKVQIYALKCFDSNYQTTVSMLAKAIKSAVDDYNCRVINMSLGLKSDRETLHEAIQYAAAKGAIIIASVGNDGDDIIYYPAGYDEVIGVGSVGSTKEISYYSQVNDSVFVVAPGESYESLQGVNDYTIKQGTSQAAPLVSAAAAILVSADNNMSLESFKNLIMNCSEDLGDAGYDTEYGYGLLNIRKMLDDRIGDYYVSQINANELIIYNNTSDDFSAVGIWGEYKNNMYVNGKTDEIFVPSRDKLKIEFLYNNEARFFLWDSLNSMRPLTAMRKSVTN